MPPQRGADHSFGGSEEMFPLNLIAFGLFGHPIFDPNGLNFWHHLHQESKTNKKILEKTATCSIRAPQHRPPAKFQWPHPESKINDFTISASLTVPDYCIFPSRASPLNQLNFLAASKSISFTKKVLKKVRPLSNMRWHPIFDPPKSPVFVKTQGAPRLV